MKHNTQNSNSQHMAHRIERIAKHLQPLDEVTETTKVLNQLNCSSSFGVGNDRAILVTGGAAGIGKAIVVRLLSLGYRVAAADYNEASLKTLKDELSSKYGASRLITIVCDVSKEESVQNTINTVVKTFGVLDGACNNAGIAGRIGFAKLADHTIDEWNATMNTNGRGVFLCMKYEIQQFLKQRKANPKADYSIVNTASVAGIGKSEGQSVYGASKHAVVSMTRTAAAEYARNGIRINSICPGMTETKMLYATGTPEEKQLVDFVLSKNFPSKRPATADEVAAAAAFLISSEASHVSGIQLAVDGAYSGH